MARLSIDIGVGGRFHADRMMHALLRARHDVRLVTSFPRSRFPMLPAERIRPILGPEILFRAARACGWPTWAEDYKMCSFGKRVAQHGRPVDLFISWSGFALESFRSPSMRKRVLVRDSAHIEVQMALLREEYLRLGVPYPARTRLIARECAEYALADEILVPSEFARQSFLRKGVPPEKLRHLPLGVDLARFRPSLYARARGPLRVIYFGTISVQKGVHHLLQAVSAIPPSRLELSLVGAVERDFAPLLAAYPALRVSPPVSHARLAPFLRGHDVFVLPSLHDGFGLTALQAMASGLVPVLSDHCGAAELIRPGENGFVFPAGDAETLRARLEALAHAPRILPPIARQAVMTSKTRSWTRYERTLRDWARHALR